MRETPLPVDLAGDSTRHSPVVTSMSSASSHVAREILDVQISASRARITRYVFSSAQCKEQDATRLLGRLEYTRSIAEWPANPPSGGDRSTVSAMKGS